MKTLVVYSTKTGNTKKVAEAVAQAIPGAELPPTPTTSSPWASGSTRAAPTRKPPTT